MKIRQSGLKLTLMFLLIILETTSCNLPGNSEKISESDQVLTSAVETVNAKLTQMSTPLTSTATIDQFHQATATKSIGAISTSTILPTDSPASTPTKIPCNWAKFIADMTYPDNSEVIASTSFTKTWRIQNIGSCEWTSDYEIIFDGGDRLGAADTTQLSSEIVKPGDIVEISVVLTSSNVPGTYQSYFLLRSPSGLVYGIGNDADSRFYSKIKVVHPTPTFSNTSLPSGTPTATFTPTATIEPLPDLQITNFTLAPDPPTKGQLVHISISVINYGTSASGPYKIKWWPEEGDPIPACSWDIVSSNPKVGQTVECDYPGYPSQTPSIITKASVDADNSSIESDESNNVSTITIEVLSP
jgi:hypothetical protein